MAKKNDKEAQENWSHKNDFPIIDKGMKEWNEAIQKMIDAFELLVDEEKYGVFTDEEEQAIDQGLELFGKYFRYLWD